MKRFKLLIFTGAALVIVTVLAGCASLTVVDVDNEATTGPRQVRQYGTIDPNDITVYAFYKDESRKRYSVGRSDITFDNTKVGRQTVNIRVSGGFTASFETEVMALTGITVVSPPVGITTGIAARDYADSFNIQGEWDGMGREKIANSECRITGLETPRQVGRRTVTVEYKGLQTTFEVGVYEVESIRITSNPTKLTYMQGEPLDLTGIEVASVYPAESGITNGRYASVSMNSISGYNSNTVGRQTVTVTLSGKTATFTVEVRENPFAAVNGTWTNSTEIGDDVYVQKTTIITRLVINNGNFERSLSGNTIIRGTVTLAGGRMTFTSTHINGAFLALAGFGTGEDPMQESFYSGNRLYTRDEITANASIPPKTKEKMLEMFSSSDTQPYTVSGNRLTLTDNDGNATVYTK